MQFRKIGIFIIFCLVFTSCKKVIESQETDLIAGEIALKTVTNAEQALIGAYAGASVETTYLLNSVFADEVAIGEFYNSATVHEWLYTPVDVTIRDNYTTINNLYRIIDRVNRVLAALPNAVAANAADVAKKNVLKGEALFLRAWSHFDLFRYYCDKYSANGVGMPYMETSTLTPGGRIDMASYFQKLYDDINTAKTLLPTTLADKNRANVPTANALHARIALYKGDWATAESNATAYINFAGLGLSPRAQYGAIWTDGNTNEVSFQLIRTALVGGRIGSLYRGTSTASVIGTVTWKPSEKLWNSYDQVNDVRFGSFLFNEPALTSAGRPSRLVKKYAGSPYGSTNENVANAKVFRTGEMYLIRAEARAELGVFTGANSAESDINDLRAARITAYAPVVFATKQLAIDAILLERFKELPFEGHRFWDIKRRGLAVQRLAIDAPVTAQTLPAGNYRFLLPIPFTEMQANPAMTQNPLYQ
jgi:starch-binding outer membrane protein, SusD/RagB family